MSKIQRLDATIRALAPIDGVSVVGQTATISFQAAATQPQRDAANAALASFDWSDAAQVAWEDVQAPERTTLRQAAAQAVSDNNTFLAIGSPTNAQVVAQVKRLTQECTALIKRLIQID